jgi:cold shock CspA family protein
MSWFHGSFADRLFGAARGIFDTILAPAQRSRAEWQDRYVAAEAAIAQQIRVIENQVQDRRGMLTFAEVTVLHRQSVQAADMAHETFTLARQSLDALGQSIVETARQRKALERRVCTARGRVRADLQREIDGLHRLRDVYLIPDKDRVKAEKNRLLAEVRRLNVRTAQLKQIRTQHQALESPRNQATVKWFDPVRGFGFLVLPDGREAYVNSAGVMHRQPLSGGMTVWCQVRQHPGGRLSAIRVSPS